MKTTLTSPENKSIFKDMIETNTHRAAYMDSGLWDVFEKKQDAFVYIGLARGHKSTPIELLISQLND